MEFEQIYRAYFRSVYLFALRLSGSEQAAEELTSETFYKAIQAIDRFHGDCEVRVWLCQIAKNTYYSQLKKRRREASLTEGALGELAAPEARLDEEMENREQARQIREILRTLPGPYREVFLWRVFGELSFKELGALYGKTDNWACVTYHRARKLIQNRLEETEHETGV